MARRAHPRRREVHEAQAGIVLQRHEARTGNRVELPVPVEDIVETAMGLTILYDVIDEPPGSKILGALSPADRTIILNERHQDLFDRVIGPERFTLAHELGHWMYDAENPDQQALDFTGEPAELFCRDMETAARHSDTARLREVNANAFAACLLMPSHLVSGVDIDEVITNFRATARRWGVSQTSLRIRLEVLGLIDDQDRDELDLR